MRLFHGTKADFKQFTIPGKGKHGEGYYLTKDFREAKSFSESLAGDGSSSCPKVYTVEANVNNLFNTMNPNHCSVVAQYLDFNYKIPKNVGEYGTNEHYNILIKQIMSQGYSKDRVNEFISLAGYDGLFYEFCDHVIVFDKDKIEIVEVEDV